MAAIDDHFYHYDALEESLSKHHITCLLEKYEEGKYKIRGEKVYEIKPKHRDEWRKKRRHVKDMGLDTGCIYVGKRCGR